MKHLTGLSWSYSNLTNSEADDSRMSTKEPIKSLYSNGIRSCGAAEHINGDINAGVEEEHIEIVKIKNMNNHNIINTSDTNTGIHREYTELIELNHSNSHYTKTKTISKTKSGVKKEYTEILTMLETIPTCKSLPRTMSTSENFIHPSNWSRSNSLPDSISSIRKNSLPSSSNTGNGLLTKSLKFSRVGLTLEEIHAQALIFFIAGYETTATSLGYIAYCLATNPDCQEKLVQEIRDKLGDKRVSGFNGILLAFV